MLVAACCASSSPRLAGAGRSVDGQLISVYCLVVVSHNRNSDCLEACFMENSSP